MKRFLLTTLMMIAGLCTLAAKAPAQTSTLVAHINEEFVAGGKTLPAGTHTVYLGSPAAGQPLILLGEKSSVFLIPSMHNQGVPGQFKVNLTRMGDVYYLSEVATDLAVYTFPAPRALTRAGKLNNHDSKPTPRAD
jgi:hypothetical protein